MFAINGDQITEEDTSLYVKINEDGVPVINFIPGGYNRDTIEWDPENLSATAIDDRSVPMYYSWYFEISGDQIKLFIDAYQPNPVNPEVVPNLEERHFEMIKVE